MGNLSKATTITYSKDELDAQELIRSGLINKKVGFCAQAEAPTTADNGDLWQDTETSVLSMAHVDGEDIVWMEI